jgi:hypothetical protein
MSGQRNKFLSKPSGLSKPSFGRNRGQGANPQSKPQSSPRRMRPGQASKPQFGSGQGKPRPSNPFSFKKPIKPANNRSQGRYQNEQASPKQGLNARPQYSSKSNKFMGSQSQVPQNRQSPPIQPKLGTRTSLTRRNDLKALQNDLHEKLQGPEQEKQPAVGTRIRPVEPPAAGGPKPPE